MHCPITHRRKVQHTFSGDRNGLYAQVTSQISLVLWRERVAPGRNDMSSLRGQWELTVQKLKPPVLRRDDLGQGAQRRPEQGE
jgi:hypothetical protein